LARFPAADHAATGENDKKCDGHQSQARRSVIPIPVWATGGGCRQSGENHSGLADLCRAVGFFCRAAEFFAWPLIDYALADYPLQDNWIERPLRLAAKIFRLAAK